MKFFQVLTTLLMFLTLVDCRSAIRPNPKKEAVTSPQNCILYPETCTAVDVQAAPVKITIQRQGQGKGSISSEDKLIHCQEETCVAEVLPGSKVVLKAIPEIDSQFIEWSDGCRGSLLTCELVIDADIKIGARFDKILTTRNSNQYEVTVEKIGSGDGKITSIPAGLKCDEQQKKCQGTFDKKALITLTAEPASGSRFKRWSLSDCREGDLICSFTSESALDVTAEFEIDASEPSSFQLTIHKVGQGRVTSAPAGIDCGTTCKAYFSRNSDMTLTAIAEPGYRFKEWSGGCRGSSALCVVNIDKELLVTATFEPVKKYRVDIVLSGNAALSGTVSSAPAGLNCYQTGGVCSAEFDEGVSVRLQASSSYGVFLDGWEGNCRGSWETCTLQMDGNKTVTARFVQGFCYGSGGGRWCHHQGILSNSDYSLRAIWGSSANDVWAVGSVTKMSEGFVILHWDGEKWKNEYEVKTGISFYSMAGLDNSQIWIGGDLDTLKAKSGGWMTVANGAHPASEIRGLFAANNGVFATNYNGASSQILKLKGNAWDVKHSVTPRLNAIWADNLLNKMWAVGDLAASATQSTILYSANQGETWNMMANTSKVDLVGVWGVDANKAWAVGKNGAILRYNGSDWNKQIYTNALYSFKRIAAVGAYMWAVGGTSGFKGLIVQSFDGGDSWTTTFESVLPTFISGVWAAADNDVWVVGEQGAIFHYRPQ